MDDPMLQQIAAGQQAGTLIAASPFDQAERLRTYRRLGSYPLYIAANIDSAAIRAEWMAQVRLLALFAFPLAAVLAISAWLSSRRARTEMAVVRRLEDETSRRQRAEVALLQAQKLEAVGRLTGGVAHDFNNLLAIVGSNVEILRRLNPDASAAGRLDAIGRAVTSGTNLTRQLLAFARKQALLPRRVVLQERVPQLLDLLRPLLGAAIRLEATVDPQTPPVGLDPALARLARARRLRRLTGVVRQRRHRGRLPGTCVAQVL